MPVQAEQLEATGAVYENNSNFEPQTVVIRHGIFWYFANEMQVVTDETTKRLVERPALVQRIANQNDTVKLTLESDYQRGIQHHAFWTEDELSQVRTIRKREAADDGTVAAEPLSVQAPNADQIDGGGSSNTEVEVKEPLDYDLNELEEAGDLIEWIQGTGMFDEVRAPNAQEVIKAAGSDRDLAKRLLSAEPLARGDLGPRATVVAGLNKVIDG